MLSTCQVDHFRAFGLVALPGLLGPERTEALRREVDTALHDAYGATYDERVIDGISGHYLPMASTLTPVSATLVCDNPVLLDAAEQLLDTPALPSVPEGVLYFAEAGWHDDGIGVRGVTFATDFDRLDATDGALRFVPCSHHADARPSLRAFAPTRTPATTTTPAPSSRPSPATSSPSTRTPSMPLSAGRTASPGPLSTWPNRPATTNGTGSYASWPTASSRPAGASSETATPPGETGSPTPNTTPNAPRSSTASAQPESSTSQAPTSAGKRTCPPGAPENPPGRHRPGKAVIPGDPANDRVPGLQAIRGEATSGRGRGGAERVCSPLQPDRRPLPPAERNRPRGRDRPATGRRRPRRRSMHQTTGSHST